MTRRRLFDICFHVGLHQRECLPIRKCRIYLGTVVKTETMSHVKYMNTEVRLGSELRYFVGGEHAGFSLQCVALHCSTQASLVVAHKLSCPSACGILVPQPGVEPMIPAMEGGFLTTEPPKKSPEGKSSVPWDDRSFAISEPQFPHL